MGPRKDQPDRQLIRAQCLSCARRDRCGFSLLELLVVIAVASLLIGLLLPGLSRLRESARRVGCSSNMHQTAIALEGFANDHHDRLPGSYFAGDDQRESKPQNMMMANRGSRWDGWDGIGRLYAKRYMTGPGSFYCPSHRGEHAPDRYDQRWTRSNTRPIFVNYHYRGTFDFSSPSADPIERHQFSSLRIERPSGMALLTDGLRTKSDFNHTDGTNILRDDLSVRWYTNPLIYKTLPVHISDPWPKRNIWTQIDEGLHHTRNE